MKAIVSDDESSYKRKPAVVKYIFVIRFYTIFYGQIIIRRKNIKKLLQQPHAAIQILNPSARRD